MHLYCFFLLLFFCQNEATVAAFTNHYVAFSSKLFTCSSSKSKQTSSLKFPLRTDSTPCFVSFDNKRRRKPSSSLFKSRNSNIDSNKITSSSSLMPQENPGLDRNQFSPLSGVNYATVLEALHKLYPPQTLQERNAISRTDGYWPFINDGKEPPKQYTYGEFDFITFAQLLDRAATYFHDYQKENVDDDPASETQKDQMMTNNSEGWENKVFCDIGSGTGRLVLGAAALHPGWKLCRGIEVLPGIHQSALEQLERCRKLPPKNDDVGGDETSQQHDGNEEVYVADEDQQAADELPSYTGSPLFDSGNDAWLESMAQYFEPIDEEEEDEDEDEESEEEEEEERENDEVFSLVDDDASKDVKDDVGGATGATKQEVVISDEQRMFENEEPEKKYVLSTAPTVGTELDDHTKRNEHELPLAPIELTNGSFEDPYLYFGDVDCAFCFSSCMTQDMMTSLGISIGRQCKPGTIVITTEFMLPLEGTIAPLDADLEMPHGEYQLELLEQVDGYCWLMGGTTTAYIHRVTKSLWIEGSGKRERPVLSAEEQAWRVVQSLEKGELTDTKKFLRNIYNTMVFLGLPESWYPSIENYDSDDHK